MLACRHILCQARKQVADAALQGKQGDVGTAQVKWRCRTCTAGPCTPAWQRPQSSTCEANNNATKKASNDNKQQQPKQKTTTIVTRRTARWRRHSQHHCSATCRKKQRQENNMWEHRVRKRQPCNSNHGHTQQQQQLHKQAPDATAGATSQKHAICQRGNSSNAKYKQAQQNVEKSKSPLPLPKQPASLAEANVETEAMHTTKSKQSKHKR